MNNFTTSLVAVASVFSNIANAQLPRECFYVTDLHGPQDSDSELLSDLPTLMAMYKPGMQLNSIITSIHEQNEEAKSNISGLQINLKNHYNRDQLALPMIGVTPDNWSSDMLSISHNRQPDRISILTDD